MVKFIYKLSELQILFMKFPICEKCLKNDILCKECAENVGEKLIKVDEIKAFKTLNKLGRKYQALKDAEVHRVVDGSNMLLVMTDRKNASKIIGKNGGMIKKLSKDLGNQIRVVSDISTFGSFVKEIFHTFPILGVNVIYGKKDEYKVRISSLEKGSLPIDPEKFSKIANSIFGVDAEMVFE